MDKLTGSYQLPTITVPQYTFRLRSDEFNRSGEAFTIWFLEGVLENKPDYIDCLLYLGNAYTASGRFEDGLKIDKKLVELKPEDPIVHYNLACSYSLVGSVDAALRELGVAITLGYRDIHHIERDKDLERLRSDERYWRLIARLKRARKMAGDREGG